MEPIQIHPMKQEIAYYSKLLYDRGLVGAAGGNVSTRWENNVLITAGGVSLRDVTAVLKLKEVPLVEFAEPGSEQLALYVEQAIRACGKDVKNLLLEKHGILSFDHGLCNAFDLAELVEETARVAFVSSLYRL